MTGPAGLVAKRAALERCLALRVDGGKLPLGWLQETCWWLNLSFQKCRGQWEPIDLGNQRFKEWTCMGDFEGFPVNNSAFVVWVGKPTVSPFLMVQQHGKRKGLAPCL